MKSKDPVKQNALRTAIGKETESRFRFIFYFSFLFRKEKRTDMIRVTAMKCNAHGDVDDGEERNEKKKKSK